MSHHRVDLAQMFEVIDRMAGFETRLESALSDTDSLVNRLHATWSGAAAEEHRSAHYQWRHGAEQMHEALAVMRRIASTAHGNYSAAADANLRMWSI